MSSLLLRCDAHRQIGMGHFFRSLALAHAARELGLAATFVMCEPDASALRPHLDAAGAALRVHPHAPGGLEDASALARMAETDGAAVVIDGYHFQRTYVETVAGRAPVVLFDDGMLLESSAAAVVNPSPLARAASYTLAPGAVTLLGPRYVQLRPGFVRRNGGEAGRSSAIRDVTQRVAVVLGGSDPHGLTAPIVAAIRELGLDVTAVVGGLTAQTPEVLALRGDPGVHLRVNVQEMAVLLRSVDVAVVGAGGTIWECMAAGVPFIAVAVADNQSDNVAYLREQGYPVLGLDAADLVAASLEALAPVERRARLTARGAASVDGRGAHRVARVVRTLVEPLAIRPADQGDMRFVWEVNNDPAVRAVSLSTGAIPWDDHVAWYARALASSTRELFVAEHAGRRVGVLRLDYQVAPDGRGEAAALEATVSVALHAEARGQGWGWFFVGLLTARALARAARVVAYVRPSNVPSVRLFEQLRYELVGEVTEHGVVVRKYVFRRPRARRPGQEVTS